MALPVIRIEKINHRGAIHIGLFFEYNNALIEEVKKLPGRRWSQTKNCWYFPVDDFNIKLVLSTFKSFAKIDYSSLISKKGSTPFMEKTSSSKRSIDELPSSYIDLLDQKRYSDSTKATYINYFKDFIIYFSGRNLETITIEEINGYLLELIRIKKISSSQQNQRINSIKFYYEKVLNREKQYFKIERPRRNNTLPSVLSPTEVRLMIDHTTNIKHKCIISLLYSAGLRRSELVSLKITDILSGSMQIRITNSKGNKDRYVGLSKQQLKLLRKYFREYRPKKWLIEGQNGGQYSGESILKVVKTSAKKAGIARRVTPHMLRHSFATHHLESGTDLRYIQVFMGHSSSKTTEGYTHVAKTDISKFKNPLDEIYSEDEL